MNVERRVIRDLINDGWRDKNSKISCNGDNIKKVTQHIRPIERLKLVRSGELKRRKYIASTFSRRAVWVEQSHIQGRTTSLQRTNNRDGVKFRRRLISQNIQLVKSLLIKRRNVIFQDHDKMTDEGLNCLCVRRC